MQRQEENHSVEDADATGEGGNWLCMVFFEMFGVIVTVYFSCRAKSKSVKLIKAQGSFCNALTIF